MSTGEPAGSQSVESIPGLETSWRSLEVGGAIIAVLGLLAILFPFVTGISVSILLGALLVVGGLVHIAHAFRARGWAGFFSQVLLAIVYAFAGVSLLANPVLGLVTLTILLVVYLFLSGIAEVVMGVGFRGNDGWVWVVASGVVSIALAALLWAGFFNVVAWALGFILGVHLLTTGISMIVVARRVRQELERPSAERTGGPEPGNP
ncbi:HdeD family acid-resistance protein [Halorarum halophilum]|uniref:HdeD family acid-resistance protein n=1 Tax=Halorarum halophilum TaxID=2743090 RepID=A0A7D5GJ23_9EURY|nr:HdeD family acid-resistance protein [Halobaculum halophilum]QLG26487.1 HdeD family acid-resistance protein [Halobaculum halophilum]